MLGRLRIGEAVEEVLTADLDLELESLPVLKDAIAHCERVRDFVSRELFAAILASEEDHVAELEKQSDMTRLMGIPNYTKQHGRPSWRAQVCQNVNSTLAPVH